MAMQNEFKAWVKHVGGQQKAGDILGVSGATVSRVQNGVDRPSPALARRIWRESGVPLATLRPDIWGGL